jgi:hypothetical protein
VNSIDLRKYHRIQHRVLAHRESEDHLRFVRDEAYLLERLYRTHPAVQDIAVFVDQLGQLVALVVSDEHDDRVHHALDTVAGDRRHARIVEFVRLTTSDPLIPMLFSGKAQPYRDLIWQFLVGGIETLARSGARFCLTCHRELDTVTSACKPPYYDWHSCDRANDGEPYCTDYCTD